MQVVKVDPFDLVIFGGTSDLARRKLIPGLYHRDEAGQLPDDCRIIGAARSDLSTEAYRQFAAEALAAVENIDETILHRFLARLDYVAVDAMSKGCWENLSALLDEKKGRIRVYYLAVAPQFFAPIAERLHSCGLASARTGERVVVEKPLGHDRDSARELNRRLGAVFDESQIYRIDHYLGKETVQNLMALRFANALYEPIWNAQHVDHVQVTVAESVGVEGRSAYYDEAGAMRDMVQNHLLQLLCLTAMEPPSHFEPDAVRDEKLKVLRALEPINAGNAEWVTARGQYEGGASSYLDDCGDPGSLTESFVAVKAEVSNWRWAGTPFYLRTGKRLRTRMSEIVVTFKEPPHSIFPPEAGKLLANKLVIRLQPSEGITFRQMIKDPGPGGMRLREAPFDMTFAKSLGIDGLRMPDAYERLVLDVVRGNQTLFMRGDEVEAAWAWVDPIIAAWREAGTAPQRYDSGSSGPEDALRLIHRDGRSWRELTV
jgi:glucose-6-phosphate 1-dehydrogenase